MEKDPVNYDEPDYSDLCRDCKNLESECRCPPLVRPLPYPKAALESAVKALQTKFKIRRMQ